MVRLRKHIHRLRHGDGVLLLKSLQISCLTGGIAADINDAIGASMQNRLQHIGMHAGSRRIGDDHIGSPV